MRAHIVHTHMRAHRTHAGTQRHTLAHSCTHSHVHTHFGRTHACTLSGTLGHTSSAAQSGCSSILHSDVRDLFVQELPQEQVQFCHKPFGDKNQTSHSWNLISSSRLCRDIPGSGMQLGLGGEREVKSRCWGHWCFNCVWKADENVGGPTATNVPIPLVPNNRLSATAAVSAFTFLKYFKPKKADIYCLNYREMWVDDLKFVKCKMVQCRSCNHLRGRSGACFKQVFLKLDLVFSRTVYLLISPELSHSPLECNFIFNVRQPFW